MTRQRVAAPPLQLPTTLRSRIYFSAPVADEFRKMCTILGVEPDALLSRIMNDFVQDNRVFFKRHGVAPKTTRHKARAR